VSSAIVHVLHPEPTGKQGLDPLPAYPHCVADLEAGRRIGAYRLEEQLGEGGMGVVFRAVREPEGGEVALKVLRAELANDETFRQRFAHEARAAVEVRHKHLVPILEAGEAEGRPYLVVVYVPGPTLEQRLAKAPPMPIDQVVRVVAHVASGLDALHAAGIVHRDVKPSNVIIDPSGAAKLTDFGLAKGRAYTVLTKPGMVMGTLDYLAPEVLRGGDATSASDLYALGCLAYECTAGRTPFSDTSMFELASAHLNIEPPDPCANRSDAPEGLSWAILQALAKEPENRPPTATAYAHLLTFAAGKRSAASPDGLSPAGRDPRATSPPESS
jgi:serine/threonine-protein kinase